jgi:hypothetical protein
MKKLMVYACVLALGCMLLFSGCKSGGGYDSLMEMSSLGIK